MSGILYNRLKKIAFKLIRFPSAAPTTVDISNSSTQTSYSLIVGKPTITEALFIYTHTHSHTQRTDFV